MSSISSKERGRRAGFLVPNVREPSTRITSIGKAAKVRDVPKKLRAFRSLVWMNWRKHGRHDLPWRKTIDPYKILVSEVMLQQTQVSRVIEKYRSFLKKFPSVRSLAKAPLSEVLAEWSGLGYNRRGKYLHDAAKMVVYTHRGDFEEALAHPLPGVGPYTRDAIRVFAFNTQAALIETNIRAAFIHHFFPHTSKVRDSLLLMYAARAVKGQDPRTWNWALMDYGALIKKLHQNPTRRSAHYVVQTKFEGSLRQARGAILKILNSGSHGDLAISHKLSFEGKRVRHALAGLEKDGLIRSEKGSWRIA